MWLPEKFVCLRLGFSGCVRKPYEAFALFSNTALQNFALSGRPTESVLLA